VQPFDRIAHRIAVKIPILAANCISDGDAVRRTDKLTVGVSQCSSIDTAIDVANYGTDNQSHSIPF